MHHNIINIIAMLQVFSVWEHYGLLLTLVKE